MEACTEGEVGSSGTKAGSALSAHVAVSKNAITQYDQTVFQGKFELLDYME